MYHIKQKKEPFGEDFQIFLADNNEGFYSLKDDAGREQIYRFNFQFVPGLKMVGNALTETLPQPGSYDDMLLTVYNNGNVPLTGMDLAVYHEHDGKAAEVFETVHLDLLKPENNSVILKKGLEGATENRQGEKVARQTSSSLSDSSEDYRYISKTVYQGYPMRALRTDQTLLKSQLLMPDKYTSFNISLLIPQGWEGSHNIFLEVDRYYTTTGRSFQQNVSGRPASGTLAANAAQDGVVSIGRDGTVRREGGLLAANSSEQGAEDLSMYKTDLTFDRIDLQNQAKDLGIEAIQWDNNGEAMVTLVVTNWAHLGSDSRDANIQIMEAYLDDETEPCFRYNLQAEVSDKETWNFDVPLSMLTDNRRAGKVTVKIKGKNYKEVGDVDNSVEILLDAETLSVRTQPESQDVPAGGEAVFHGEPAGGRAPYRYQWQVKKPGGQWTDLEGETTDTLRVSGVTAEESGTQYRLVITDASDYTVTTYAATLTVKQVPPTGDSAPLVWYALGIFAAIGVLACIAFKKKKENEA